MINQVSDKPKKRSFSLSFYHQIHFHGAQRIFQRRYRFIESNLEKSNSLSIFPLDCFSYEIRGKIQKISEISID